MRTAHGFQYKTPDDNEDVMPGIQRYNLSIMKAIHFILVAAVVGLTSSCNKEDDDNPTSACTTTCQNGGSVTADCECDCPNGFYGTNCEYQLTPTAFTISQIKLMDWPATFNQGQIAYSWDANGGAPDIYFRFGLGSSLHALTGHFSNCQQGVAYVYNDLNDPNHFPITLSNGVLYDLKIMDEDGSQDMTMLNSAINMSNFDNGLLTEITLYAEGFSFKLYGTWQF